MALACGITVKHLYDRDMLSDWKTWLEFSVAIAYLALIHVIVPFFAMIYQTASRKKHERLYFFLIAKAGLVYVLLWLTEPLWQLYSLCAISILLCLAADSASIALLLYWPLALRWDQTGLSGGVFLTGAILAICGQMWLDIFVQLSWRCRRFCYHELGLKWCYKRRVIKPYQTHQPAKS